MKKIRERKIGQTFKYRNMFVRVDKITYCNCYNCAFSAQNKGNSIGYYDNRFASGMNFHKCALKHRCNRILRKDGENVIFTCIKKIT